MNKTPIVITDCGLGDSSKGKWTDFLVRKFNKNLVVRFNGSGNAAHNVLVNNKIHHTFSQFGSGTLAGSASLFSRHTLIEPLALENEARILSEKVPFNPFSKLFLDSRAKLITPFHVIANRLTSKSGTTTGMGLGICVQDSLDRSDFLTLTDLRSADLKNKLLRTKEYIQNKYGSNSAYDIDIHSLFKKYNSISANLNILESAEVNELLNRSNLIFEGSQGVLLDESVGLGLDVTWSRTTKHNALEVLAEAGITEKPINIGLARVYAHRHGFGVLPTYDAHLTSILPEPHNSYNNWQGEFKCGFADLELLKYAIKVNDGIDYLALSHVDYLKKLDNWNVSVGYLNCDMFVPTNLAEQALLGQRLFNAVPQYEKIKSADVPSFLSKELNQKIFGVSYGAESNKTIVSNVYG